MHHARKEKGFTLIELLTVISIIALIASIMLTSFSAARRAAHVARAIADLRQISNALEYRYQDTSSYPDSGGTWNGLYSCWGISDPVWIDDITPNYFVELPHAPTNSTDCDKNYIYFSDGKDYKLIWMNGENADKIVTAYPNLNDPARSGYAYGFWSSGATDW